MAENKYIFNPDTLEYEDKGDSKTKRILISIMSIFIGSVFVFIIIFIIFSYYYEAKYITKPQSEFKILKQQYEILIERKQQNDKYLNELIEKDKKIYQAVFKSNPDNSIFERKNPFTKFLGVNVMSIVRENKKRLTSFENITKKHKTDYKKIIELLKSNKKSSFRNIPAIQPIFNNDLKYPVYGFGKRIDQVYKSLVFHPGIDYAAPEGTPVFAVADGTIEQAGTKRGLGKRIIINHKNGYKTIYAHLGKVLTGSGKKVERGDKIGTIGMTGKSLISHLHYQINYKNTPINPVNYFFLDLNPEQYDQIRKQSAKSGLSLD